MEKEQENKLPFLDVLVTHREQGFRSSVYRKPTFTRQYLNFNSHHPYNVKGIVCYLQHRGKTISHGMDTYQEEIISIRHKLRHNNYPELITWRCPWCNGYRRRNWTRRHEFKSWTDCISHSTNTLGKGMNPIILPPAMGK